MSASRLKDCCLVEVKAHRTSIKDKKGKFETSCSGILISQKHGLVLSQGTVLYSAMAASPQKAGEFMESGLFKPELFKNMLVSVLLEKTMPNNPNSLDQNRNTTSKYSTALLNVTSGSVSTGQTEKWAGEISHVWKVTEFENYLTKLFPRADGWKFVDESLEKKETKTNDEDAKKTSDEVEADKVCALLPFFVLIKLHNWKPRNHRMDLVPSRTMKVGQPVFVVGTPFGNMSPPVFLNSVSKGILCNTAGRNNELLLTDARCIPGAEGGAVYCGSYPNRLQLAAMIVAPLCWKANEWIGLTICCSLSSILESLSTSYEKVGHTINGSINTPIRALYVPSSTTRPEILFIHNGGSWGTGILISKQHGLVLTCSHVVKSASSVRARTEKLVWHDADVIYASPNGKVFDLALLRLKNWQSEAPSEGEETGLVDVSEHFREGDPVLMVGHAVFDRNHQMTPSVTEGIIARVVSFGQQPVMLQSSCAVHGGASGGPLLDQSGRLVGLVTCNARDTKSGASYPHVNMSVPLKTVWPALNDYLESGDSKVLEKLQVRNKDVQKLWMLQLKEVGHVTTDEDETAKRKSSKL